MTNTRLITLGGREFAVPALPLRINMIVYPICRDLIKAELIDRCLAAYGQLDCTKDEMDQLVEMAWQCAKLADPSMDRAAFEDLPVSPPELISALFEVRYLTGAWVSTPPAQEGQDAAEGEQEGGKSLQTSTSIESSQD